MEWNAGGDDKWGWVVSFLYHFFFFFFCSHLEKLYAELIGCSGHGDRLHTMRSRQSTRKEGTMAVETSCSASHRTSRSSGHEARRGAPGKGQTGVLGLTHSTLLTPHSTPRKSQLMLRLTVPLAGHLDVRPARHGMRQTMNNSKPASHRVRLQGRTAGCTHRPRQVAS